MLPNYSGNWVGSTLVYYRLAGELAAAGHQVDVWHPAVDEEKRGLRAELRGRLWAARRARMVEPVSWHDFPQGVRPRFRSGLGGLSLDHDLVVAFSWRALEALDRVRISGKVFGYVVEYETWVEADTALRERMRRAYHRGVPLLCSSEAVRGMLVEMGCRDVRLSVHGIDRDTYRVDPSATRPPLRLGCPVRMEPVKSPEVLEAALRLLRERHGSRLSLWGFGGRHAPASMLELFDEMHPSPSSPELAALYNGSGQFLLPSRLEGFGMPAAEAISCGAATIVADNGGIHTFGRHDENCWIVPANDPRAIVDAVERLAGDAGLRERLSRTGPDSLEFLSWPAAGARLRSALGLP